MRKHGLAWFTLAAGLLLVSCSPRVDQVTEIHARQEVAVLKSITPVSPEAEGLIAAPLTAPVDSLPPLPFSDEPSRAGSAIQTALRSGFDSYAAGGGATNIGGGKLLSATAGSSSWAVYQLPGIPSGAQLQQLEVDVSSGAFGGNAPGYWIGVSNYASGSWVTLGRSETDFQRVLTGSDYVSPGGNMYVFALVVDAQAVIVDSVSVTYDSVPVSGWTEITLDAGGNNGWTPAIAVDYYGSIWLAWANHADGTARYAYGLATADLSLLGSWETGYIDKNPESGKARYTDLVIDPRYRFPVASLNYVEQSAGTDNSQAGMSVFRVGPQGQRVWFNFTFGKMDGARDTTIDFDPVSNFFGIATVAGNANSPGMQANDMHVRYIDLGVLNQPDDDVVKSNSSLGEGLFYPHLRFNPGAQRTRVLAAGATLFSNTSHPSTNNPTFTTRLEAAGAAPFGSIAYNPSASGSRYGITFSKIIGNSHVLFYNSYNSEGAEASVEEVDAILQPASGEWMGGTSQLAYTWDGEPLIAYTVKKGSEVEVKLARRVAGSWDSETVSNEPSGPGLTPQDVQVDLGVEPLDYFPEFPRTERAFVVWRHIAGSSGEVRCAFKAFP